MFGLSGFRRKDQDLSFFCSIVLFKRRSVRQSLMEELYLVVVEKDELENPDLITDNIFLTFSAGHDAELN